MRTGDLVRFGLVVLLVTALNATLWWLNEGIGVRYLQNRRRQLIERLGMQGVTEDFGTTAPGDTA